MPTVGPLTPVLWPPPLSLSLPPLSPPVSSTVSFAYPPSNVPGVSSELTVDVQDSVILSYTSNFEHAWIYLYCNTTKSAESEESMSPSFPSSKTSLMYLATLN